MKLALRIAAFVVAFAVLWFVATAPWQAFFVWPWRVPAAAWSPLGRGSPDLALLLAIAAIGALAGRPRLVATLCGAVLLVTTVLRLAIDLLPYVYHQPFELADVKRLPGLLHLLLVDATVAGQVLFWSALALGTPLLAWLLGVAMACVVRPFVGRQATSAMAIGSLALAVSWAWPRPLWAPSTLLHVADLAVADGRIACDPEPEAAKLRSRIAAGASAMATAPHDLRGLAGVDVHVLVIESYGAAALRQPELASHFAALWQQLEVELRGGGFAAASAFVHPSITGGSSHLSHQELFTAVRVDRERVWKAVLGSDCVALPKVFQRAGWHTADLMPAMPRHWPEGRDFYGFAQEVARPDLAYDGTAYTFGVVPDQVALHWLLTNVVVPATKPVFTAFISTTSHSPWPSVPAYVPDWRFDDTVLNAPPAQIFDTAFADLADAPRMVPAYRAALDYALRTAVGFVQRLPRPSLVLVLGDHQPPIGFTQQPIDRSLDVPLHVFTNRDELLEPWRAAGWRDGCDPAGTTSSPLAAVAPLLLRAYSR